MYVMRYEWSRLQLSDLFPEVSVIFVQLTNLRLEVAVPLGHLRQRLFVFHKLRTIA